MDDQTLRQQRADEFLSVLSFWRRTKNGPMPDLINARLSGVRLREADLSGVMMQGCDFDNADFRYANLIDANLHGCNLKGANLDRAVLTGATMTSVDASGADFRMASMMNVNLRDALLAGIRVDGTDYFINAGMDNRGYYFNGVYHKQGGWMISAGCRWFSVAQAKDHWGAKYNLDALARVALIEVSGAKAF